MKNLWLLAISLLVVSCNGANGVEPPTPPTQSAEINLDKSTLGLAYVASDNVVKITSNSEWVIEGANDWCKVDKSSGSGDAQVVISVTKNENFEQRKASLIFKAKKVVTKSDFATVVVIQNEAGGLIVKTGDTEFDRHGGGLKVELLTNLQYDVVSSETWVKLVEAKALVPDSKNFSIDPNSDLVERSAMIIFKDKASEIADTLYVKQSPTGVEQQIVEKQWDGKYRGDFYYEIFPRSFADSDGDKIGDLNGVTAKLQYIKDLGCTGIWLTPINPSPSYHGYDVTDYKGVNPQFGSMADFDALIAEANKMGIKVILDFVINHSSNQHPWFIEADKNANSTERGYYMMYDRNANIKEMCESGQIPMIEDKKYNAGMWRVSSNANRYYGMFDGSMPDLNYGVLPNLNPVYDKVVDAAKFWMAKGASGLRLDAVKHIYQDSKSPQNWEFLNRFYNDVKAAYPNVYMVGEVLGGMDETAPYFQGLPSLFHFDAWWKLEGAIQNATGKYYAKDMIDAINKFKANRGDFNACIKLSNHDEDRAISKLGNSVEKAKVAFAVIATTPGQPYIYYGEEIGMSGMKDNDDKNVREPMLWGDNYYADWFTPKNATEARLENVQKQLVNEASLLNFYKDFAKLRNSIPALANGDITYPNLETTPNELMVYTRSYNGEKVMVVVNTSNKTIDYNCKENVKGAIKSHNNAKILKLQKTEDGYIFEMPALSVLVIEL